MEKPSLQETIIYGGAFNPPTLAHQAILQACVDYAEPRAADVWLLPSASRRDKDIAVSRERRIALCEALCQDIVKRTVTIATNTAELDRDRPTETYDTVRELAASHEDRSFTWVFGSDSVATMRDWNSGEWLYDNLSMLVIERPGSPVFQLGAQAARLEVMTGDVSSTELRRRIAAGEPYDELVGKSVAGLLEK